MQGIFTLSIPVFTTYCYCSGKQNGSSVQDLALNFNCIVKKALYEVAPDLKTLCQQLNCPLENGRCTALKEKL